ncbi:MAG: hypothetical protein ACK5MN_08065 [Lachnospiraceae bacterium]
MGGKQVGKRVLCAVTVLVLLLAMTLPVSAANTNDMYRLYNQNNGEHFYTKTAVTCPRFLYQSQC